ncbi:efflux RND transporter permease subunit [Candidatus Nitrospira nitrificans]|uniref:Cation efflux system protein CzcA n=1 Tax=Candidatus Nitrospira nitrificans TaxID=1742973 RepID=A0A0S4LH63_9BACT|nr:CusA/CzcA family heavy metal efflux RND transporter [Candidatus Nitrospira nitrificans]CUS35904.1 Cation efflux system protein CzcA [Candidatus Nitrospira nitrificans]
MMERLIRLSLEQRLIVLLAGAALIVGGVAAFNRLSIDAFPDVTPVQVQVITRAPALAPPEIERLVTFPLEIELTNLPGKTELRSVSRFGLSVITVVFEESVDIYFARQLILERLVQTRSKLPRGAEPLLGPVSTGLSEVFMYLMEGPSHDLLDLRTLQDWVVRPMLRAVPGLADVDTLGGLAKQYEVLVDPSRLTSLSLTLRRVQTAVTENNQNAGGSYIEKGGDKLVVTGQGLARSSEDLERIVVAAHKGTPVYLRDVAQVRQGHAVRLGGVTRDGKGEVLEGIAVMMRGGNSREVVSAVKDKVALINRVLPAGVTLTPFYDRLELVTRALDTVERALLEGAAVVVLVLYLFLRNVRGALVVALMLPLATLATFLIMQRTGLSANLMSLGGLAISLGMIVDAAIVQVENVERHLNERSEGLSPPTTLAERLPVVLRAVLEVRRPSLFGELIIALTFVPLLTLQGIEGKMFIPLALTVVIVLLSSLALSMTVVPVLAAMLMRPRPAKGAGHALTRGRRYYRRFLEQAIRQTPVVIWAASALLAGGLALIPFIGREFVPIMDEGSVVVNLVRLPSISLSESLKIAGEVERLLLDIPDVRSVVSRTGANELGTDPMGMELSDMYVLLKPESERRARTKSEIEQQIRERLEQVPGIAFGLSQPIAMRVDELVSGVRSQVAIKLFGDDLTMLQVKADEIARTVRQVKGLSDLRVERIAGLYYLKLDIDRSKVARHGINVADITEVIEAVGAGIEAGEVFEGQRRFPIMVRFPDDRRADVESIAALWVTAPDGSRIPLRELADIQIVEGPAQISREQASRRIVVEVNVIGRDLVGAVEEAQAAVGSLVRLPPGYYVTWGGQFENQQRAMTRLAIVVPLVTGLIFLLLFLTFGNLRQAALILLAIPFAMVGGLAALLIAGLYLSVPASVGFIALFGVAVLNGVVKISYINQLRHQGMPLDEAVLTGMVMRLRPILMTALVAALGLMPLLLASGPGSEIQRPLATVVIGGLISSTALTLIVLPVLYRWIEQRAEQRISDPQPDMRPATVRGAS